MSIADITCLRDLLPAAGGELRRINATGCRAVPNPFWKLTDASELLGQLPGKPQHKPQAGKDAELRAQIALLLRRHPDGLSAPQISRRLTDLGVIEIEGSTVRKKLRTWDEFKLTGSGRHQRFVLTSR